MKRPRVSHWVALAVLVVSLAVAAVGAGWTWDGQPTDQPTIGDTPAAPADTPVIDGWTWD